MPLDSKWASAEPVADPNSAKKATQPKKSSHRSGNKGRHSKKHEPANQVSLDDDTEGEFTDSDVSRPNSSRKSAVFDKARPHRSQNHSSSSDSGKENPLAMALGISLDPVHQKKHQKQSKGTSKHVAQDVTQEKLDAGSSSKGKKSQLLKKKMEEQKRLLEENKRKAEQKELINSLLDGDDSFDWEDDESELILKLQT